jgi:hypothetical protein
MRGLKSILYMTSALGMILVAVTQLDFRDGSALVAVFDIVWILFALLIIAAHLHEILGVDEELRKELERNERMTKWQTEQMLQGKRSMLRARK